MSINGEEYNHYDSPFSDKRKSSQYVAFAMANNIKHSLKNYDYEIHFGNLKEYLDLIADIKILFADADKTQETRMIIT